MRLKSIVNLFMGKTRFHVKDEIPKEHEEIAHGKPEPFKFIGDLSGQKVTGIFLQAEENSSLDQMSGGMAAKVLDHLLNQVFDGSRSTGVNAAFTRNGPRPDRKMLIWQNNNASIDKLVMAANAMQVFLRDLGFTRHDPVELSFDERRDSKITSDQKSSMAIKASAEAKTPELFMASAKLSGEADMDLSQTRAKESALSMNKKDDLVIQGWAYDAGMVEAITHRLGIPSPKELIVTTNKFTTNAAIRGDVDSSVAPFENLHDYLIELERYALWVADNMGENTGRDKKFSQFVEVGDTNGALEYQLDRARTASERTPQEHTEAEVKLAMTLCASIYRGAQYRIEEQLGEMVGNDILRAVDKLHADQRKSGKMKVNVTTNTELRDKPEDGFYPVNAISEKTESMKTLDRIGLQAYYQVKPGLSEVSVVLFPRMTDKNVNLDSVSNTSVMTPKEEIDIKSTTVYHAFAKRRELNNRVEKAINDLIISQS